MRKLVVFGVAAAAVAMAVPSAAVAAGGPPVVFTDAVVGSVVQSFAGPCGGGAGTVSIEFHDVFHITEFDDGSVTVTENQAGSFAFDPDDPAAPSSTGRYRNGFSQTSTQNTFSDTSVFTVVGRDENGGQVKFQLRSQYTLANGEVRVDNTTLSCG
jgi:hypothetical protein